MKKNRMFYVYSLACPITGKVKYVGCTTNLKIRFSSHINTAKIVDVDRKNEKNIWIYQLLQNNLKPKLKLEFETNNIELASEKEGYFYNLYKDNCLFGKDPNIFRYNNQCSDDSIRSKEINYLLIKLISDSIISKEDLFKAIYFKSSMSFKTSGIRIERKLKSWFSDEEIYKIYVYLKNIGIEIPLELPFKVKQLLKAA